METAYIEPIGGVIRVFADGKTYGDKYEYSAAFRTLSNTRVEVIGIMTAPTPSQWRAMSKCFVKAGYTEHVVTRIRADGTVEKRVHKFPQRYKDEP